MPMERIVLGAGERLEKRFVILPGESQDIDLDVSLAGEGADFSLKGLYLCSGSDRVNINVTVRHLVGGGTSRQTVKGLAAGNARVSFGGLIVVQQDAQKTEAYQENHNILLSEKADIQTRPQLEIYADDVKCSHGATVGRLNEDELFYMRSRGIPEAEAKALQMMSFLSPVMDESRREEIENAILNLL